MIAPETRTERVTPLASRPIPEEDKYEPPTPAQTLAGLYRRCGRGGGSPYTLDQIIQVLCKLRTHQAVIATDIADSVRMPASAVYGCVLELEDYGLARWIEHPVTSADNITAKITEAGDRLLREINLPAGATLVV